jgi:hypothetical protein
MKKTNSDNRRIVWLLTILTMLFCILFIQHIAIDTLSAYASIFSTAAAFIAVIWFYNGLHLQSFQINFRRPYGRGIPPDTMIAKQPAIIATQKCVVDFIPRPHGRGTSEDD